MSEASEGKQIPSPDEVLREHRLGFMLPALSGGLGVLVLAGMAFLLNLEGVSTVVLVLGIVGLISLQSFLQTASARSRLTACKRLVELGHVQAAVAELKRLLDTDAVKDEACFLIGGAYESSGELAVALESYRRYLREFRDGDWTVEAQVRVDALATPASAPAVVEVQDKSSEDQVVCPFCRDQLANEALSAECADCGTPHHLGCYEEQGGCSVYGCRSRTAKARLRERE